uniref:SAM domain-containing protein n=1 Tax=Oryza meridionalis TaxID=40149 RepID=A0A0E0FC58_9ORYZ
MRKGLHPQMQWISYVTQSGRLMNIMMTKISHTSKVHHMRAKRQMAQSLGQIAKFKRRYELEAEENNGSWKSGTKLRMEEDGNDHNPSSPASADDLVLAAAFPRKPRSLEAAQGESVAAAAAAEEEEEEAAEGEVVDVVEWLWGIGMGRYVAAFEAHEVDGEVLPCLTMDDLRDMGIGAVGARRKLYCAIQRLPPPPALPPPPPPPPRSISAGTDANSQSRRREFPPRLQGGEACVRPRPPVEHSYALRHLGPALNILVSDFHDPLPRRRRAMSSTITNVAEDSKKGLAEFLDRLDSIRGKLSDLDNQQQAHHIAIQRLERAGCNRSLRRNNHDRDDDHDNDGRRGDRPPRYHKIDFPKFDGQGDPLHFLNCCEQFFQGQRTPEEQKVWLASYHLLDGARQWYMRIERDLGTPTWRRFFDLLNLHFGRRYARRLWANSPPADARQRWPPTSTTSSTCSLALVLSRRSSK